MPHLHGVFWLEEKKVKEYKEKEDDEEFSDEKVVHLIDEWISCSIDTGDEDLNELVKELNIHKHTKSCQKGNNPCRFSFPRLPSNRTLISNPLSEEELGKTKYAEKLHDAKETLKKVKNKLEGDS